MGGPARGATAPQGWGVPFGDRTRRAYRCEGRAVDEGLGRLHSRRTPAGAAACDRRPGRPRARGLRDRPRVRADRGCARATRDPLHLGGQSRGGVDRGQGMGRGGPLDGPGPDRLGASSRPGDRPRLGRSGRRLGTVPDPLGADAGLRVRRPAATDQLRRRQAGPRPRLDPARPTAEDRRQGGKAGPLPGPQGGVLPGRVRARPGGPRRARAGPRAGPCRRPAAA